MEKGEADQKIFRWYVKRRNGIGCSQGRLCPLFFRPGYYTGMRFFATL